MMIAQHRKLLAILLVLLLAPGALVAPNAPALPMPPYSAQAAQGTMPDGLMSAFLAASSEPFAPQADGHHAHSGGLDVTLDTSGLQTNLGGLTWRLALRGLGRGRQTTALPQAEIVQTHDRLEYRRGVLTEWYRDTAMGIEQGFTVHEPPPGAGPLVVHLDLSTELTGAVDADGRGLSFAGPDGRVLRYDHLRAWDADGTRLEAQLSYARGQVALQVNDRGAVYPLTVDPLIYVEQKLIASDAEGGGEVGAQVALWGDTALVGAPYQVVGGGDRGQGAAYVFAWDGSSWSEQARLTASDGSESDFFGNSVALWGDTAVVGAPGDDVGLNYDQGSVYVFTRSETAWHEQAFLSALDGGPSDNFGVSVALWGDTALVGAPGDDVLTNIDQGSAYVFSMNGATWMQEAHLVASDGTECDVFGSSVALAEDTSLVGAHGDNVGTNDDQGSAYVFTRSGTTWTEQAHLSASDGGRMDQFGYSTAMWGDTALVGAPHSDYDQGSARVFTRSGTTWSEQARLTASDGQRWDGFGGSVTLWGDTALVGAGGWEGALGPSDQGSAYVFTRIGTTWSEQVHLIPSDGVSGASFGSSVALWGNTALIGAPHDHVGSVGHKGSAYLYDALPAITTITRFGPDPTNASSVDFAANFSEDVTGVDASDFALTITGSISSTAVTAVTGSGETYTVTVSTGTGSGTLRLDVRTSATITDLTGNSLIGLPYTDGETYTVDRDAPAVASIIRAHPSPTHVPSVSFAVTFSEDVTSVDASDFALSTTGSIIGVEVTAVSGSDATYTVTVAIGSGMGTLRLDVPASATVTDLAGNPLSGLPYTSGEAYTIAYVTYLPIVLKPRP